MKPSSKITYTLRRRAAWARLHTVFVLWTISVLAGFAALSAYSRTPGIEKTGATHWPEGSALIQNGQPMLLIFLHPRCPCSQASLEQFNRIQARVNTRYGACIVFVRPRGVPEGWERNDLWSAAQKFAGVQIYVDDEGVEARRFGAATSGATYLFDPSGNLLFHGGITGERGHAGDNVGADAVRVGLGTGHSDPQHTPVFGCPLFE